MKKVSLLVITFSILVGSLSSTYAYSIDFLTGITDAKSFLVPVGVNSSNLLDNEPEKHALLEPWIGVSYGLAPNLDIWTFGALSSVIA